MEQSRTSDGKISVVSSRDAEELLHGDLYGLDHEEAWILYLTSQNRLIDKEMVSKGTLKQTSIDCRTILRQALLHNASAIIVSHNHPSGISTPSASDIQLTRKLMDACRMLDISLLDHIIVGDEDFYSFSDEQTHKIIN